MKISIAPIDFDIRGPLVLEVEETRSDFETFERRVAVNPTLDGGTVFEDRGFAESDRQLNFRVLGTHTTPEVFRPMGWVSIQKPNQARPNRMAPSAKILSLWLDWSKRMNRDTFSPATWLSHPRTFQVSTAKFILHRLNERSFLPVIQSPYLKLKA